ncbi:MAG: hypothetical protein P8P32_07340 [Akkermansiaceae bacterium]|nr:hypothetical protein [Akkermansiaceae bacterium]MDG1671627.1 hypothetical protein [Akkermansiaceae bacterium]MDG2324109.1 hypothetical protein [Akkermansiaceae bacterium]
MAWPTITSNEYTPPGLGADDASVPDRVDSRAFESGTSEDDEKGSKGTVWEYATPLNEQIKAIKDNETPL